MNQQHANRLTAVEMDFWRRAARKSKLERIRNTEIRRMMHAERTIMDGIEHRRLQWYKNKVFRKIFGLRKTKLQRNGESYTMLSYMHCILPLT